MSKNLIARIAVAAVAIPAILWVCYQGGNWLKGMLVFFSIVAMVEFLYNEKIKFSQPVYWLFVLAMLISLTQNLQLNFLWTNWVVLSAKTDKILLFLLVAGMFFSVGKESPAELFSKYTRLFWGFLYISVLYPMVFALSTFGTDSYLGGDLLLFLFGLLWVGDSAAMFGGKAFGKHKLAPSVSPNKTVEGFISGIIGALIIGVVMYYWKLEAIGLTHLLIISLGCSIFGQLGDLVESMWKRSLNIKDSSAIIPGHGGILDRFDSLLFATPFICYYLLYII